MSPVPRAGAAGRAAAAASWPLPALARPAAYLVTLALCLAPVWSVEILPLQDYLGHMARMYLLGPGAADPIVNRIYMIEWAPVPNLAMDVIIPPLSRIVGLFDAGRIFVSLSLALWILGPAWSRMPCSAGCRLCRSARRCSRSTTPCCGGS
jgi:hypothetical protein